MSEAWRDRLTGARMQVDQQFRSRIRNSQFSNQQWGLVMTAVEFQIENATTPENARLVADTEQLPQIMPELEDIPQAMGGQPRRDSSGGGLLGRVRELFGDGDGESVDQEKLDAARQLAEEYADTLQSHLEQEGRWADICAAATE
jgi:hypothetical protein